ncbi:hypothetical protein MRU69_03745 [Kocuria flava]|uniref:hypothetical protein n=1 Tax=Kocuria flava TaxID=446860 RepID=UPI001FF46E42|nr:hypothetical protein [Kocuria flava]MCJ8503980.1 hypothetical protein [Kocuria flava]
MPERFVGFFDDAAIFPPGLAPLEQALADHVARRAHRLDEAVGPAVLGLDNLPEAQRIAAALARGGRPIDVSAVTPAGRLQDALETAERIGPELRMVSVELKTDPTDAPTWKAQIAEAAQVQQLPVFVELTADQVDAGALDLMKGTGLRLKYRTGGIEAHLFPTPEQLAAVLVKAVDAGVPFKLTAGLHEAVRYTDPRTGFTHHGFLNIAMATEAARQGLGTQRVAELLVETDPGRLIDLARTSDGSWRESFTSFGTCSVGEPAASLERLGLFPPGLA